MLFRLMLNGSIQALLAEGRFYSDLELTEKEIERMVMEASRAEYVANDKFRQQLGCRESSTSNAEPSSSGASKFELACSSIDQDSDYLDPANLFLLNRRVIG